MVKKIYVNEESSMCLRGNNIFHLSRSDIKKNNIIAINRAISTLMWQRAIKQSLISKGGAISTIGMWSSDSIDSVWHCGDV